MFNRMIAWRRKQQPTMLDWTKVIVGCFAMGVTATTVAKPLINAVTIRPAAMRYLFDATTVIGTLALTLVVVLGVIAVAHRTVTRR